MIVGIQEEILLLHERGVLPILLQDHTTKSNILWATDAYKELGPEYCRNQQILPELITGAHSGVIKNRARKAMEQQSERTKQYAEVFTPLWVCEKMNDYADQQWFGRELGFKKIYPETGKVVFTQKKTWRRYVDSRRLEITCGEAPYLVSRYDAATGELIPLDRRIGLLDRKLRAVGENAGDEDEWLDWAKRALQATYGYEFQGDNLLIARLNLLMSFAEHLQYYLQRKASIRELQAAAEIISWNIWQMDGLKDTIPYCLPEEDPAQMNLFDLMGPPIWNDKQSDLFGEAERQPYCLIRDWRGKEIIEFRSMKKGDKRK